LAFESSYSSCLLLCRSFLVISHRYIVITTLMKIMRPALRVMGLVCLTATSCSPYQKSEVAQNSGQAVALPNLVQYAKPMCGTGTAQDVQWGDNNTYPGAVAPFGMIQWSPDTDNGRHVCGYGDEGKRISDFSVDHISGAGCPYGEDFAMMLILGHQPSSPPSERSAFAQPFSHTNEIAKPGYYRVTFDNGLRVELTATTRTGFGRFVYPGHEPATLMINASSDINGSAASGINLNPATREISGWSVGGHFCGTREVRTIYFYAIFNRPFQAWSSWTDNKLVKGATNASGTTSGAFITFNTSNNRTVLAKVGISYVSTANAKANVEAESPLSEFASQDFDHAVKSTSDVWNKWLNKVQVSGGTKDEKEKFYSMLYHALLGPEVVSDVNGRYLGYDGKVHTTEDGREQYGVFSGWDIYRSECQLLAMLAPKQASDMAQSLLMDFEQGGAFPRWGVITEDSGVMMGDPAAPMIADFYAFGATNFDATAALKGLVRAATDPSLRAPRTEINERDALADYLKLGYVPEHQEGGYGNVSMTLEYASADFALSQFAKTLGDESDSAMLMEHAQNWRNLYNPKTGYMQMRQRDGQWAPGFKNNVGSYDNDQAYVEGTAGQYLWMVPFNEAGLANLLGGPDEAVKLLDRFFTRLNVGDHGTDGWMAWLGNEPSLETPWIYDFWGQPWNTQKIVRQAMTELYSSGDAAYSGNDDVGEMSSWYIFGALGMYPELPGSDVLVLGSPLFPKAVVHLAGGDITIIGKGAMKDAPYVHNLRVNGQAWNKPWFSYFNISHGGTLVYDLSTTPDIHWGSNPSDTPPSYDGAK
jgi:predicted alpha-1,2-mannosidase